MSFGVAGWLGWPARLGNTLLFGRANFTNSLHPKSTASLHHFEKLLIFLALVPIQACDFKVAPKRTHVVGLSLYGTWHPGGFHQNKYVRNPT